MKHYIITGASGHIGNNLVRMINETEPTSKVTVLTRRKITAELEGTVCEQLVGDITDKAFLKDSITEDSIVIHLAALIDMEDCKKEECCKINYLLTKDICDICRDMGVKRFIYVGSVDGIYKGQEGEISEPEEFFPEKVEGNYGKTKAMAMQYVMSEVEKLNAAIVIPSAVIGINDRKPSAVGKVILSALKNKAEFGIEGGYNFVDVLDVCRVILTLSDNSFRECFIVSGENVSVEEVYYKINKIKNFSKKPIIIPMFVVKIFSPFIKVLNKTTLRALTEPHNYSCEKAKEKLGYIPTPIDKTFSDTVKWFEDYFKL